MDVTARLWLDAVVCLLWSGLVCLGLLCSDALACSWQALSISQAAAHDSQAGRATQDGGPAAMQKARQRTPTRGQLLQRVGVDLPNAMLQV